jgi:hypothetical protein
MISTQNESCIILGDKTGDVYSLNIEQSNIETSEFKLIMGHLSMLTDLVVTIIKFLLPV